MKKQLFLFVTTLFVTTQIFSQVTLFEDNFNADIPVGETFSTYVNWISTSNDSEGRTFEVFDVEAFKAGPVDSPNLRQGFPMSGYAIDSDSWEGGEPTLIFFPNNFITTKEVIDLTNVTAPANVSFLIGTYQTDGSYLGDNYSVYLTTVNTPNDIENETSIYTGLISDLVTANSSDASESAVTQTIDVSSFIGGSYYLTFRHHDCTNENSVLIDDVKVEANSVASLEDLESIGFNYYPNPVINELNMRANSEISEIIISNVLGQKMLRISPNSLNSKINTENLNSGIYMVQVKAGDLNGTFKFIKK